MADARATSAETEPQRTIRILPGLDRVDAADWNACAGDSNPFLCWEFLQALEQSGSVGEGTGWLPQHLVVEDEAGRIAAVAPLYAKSHSYGEYVFDHGWADAYERAGGHYYPKLLCAVPFTPVPGPRLLVRPGEDTAEMRRLLAAAMEAVSERLGVSSVHVTFEPAEEWELLGEQGWLQRIGQQYHWQNEGYRDFDAFLADLSARKRKQIRRERRDAVPEGVSVRTLTGDALRPEHWAAFDRFYRSTSDRKWGWPYLTRDFFDLLGERMADRVALVMAFRGDRPIAGALNLVGRDAIYGRNWGADEHIPFLHFELCYYRAIDFAIARGLSRVEAGAQGQHKIQRGYRPRKTYSAHYIRDPALRRAIADYLRRETTAVDWEIATLDREATPFRRT